MKIFKFSIFLIAFLAACGISFANDTIRFTWQVNSNWKYVNELSSNIEGNITIDWGDGVVEIKEQFSYGRNIGHRYEETGSCTVTIAGSTADLMFTLLDVSYCQLTNLDIRNSTTLATLSCYLNQLTNLDISTNTELMSLCCDVNQLTNLDVSCNTKLTVLDCSSNRLTSLDVSKDTALEFLYCSNNQLTSLDLSKNVELSDLDCSVNLLTNLDLSKNLELQYLYCSNNQLTSLIIDDNSALGIFNVENNALPLSTLHKLSKQALPKEDQYLGRQNLLPVKLDVNGNYGDGENEFDGIYTEYVVQRRSGIANEGTEDYSVNNGIITFIKEGVYFLTITNAAIISQELHPMEVSVVITVGNAVLTADTIRFVWQAGENSYKYFNIESLDNYTINWGDSSTNTYTLNNQNLYHTYTAAGNYTVTITGTAIIGIKLYSASVTSIVAKNCAALKRLECTYNNQLTNLDLSGCTALTRLDCSNNQLLNLNLSGCTVLENLFCWSNVLRNLDVSSCTALTHFDCYNNQLTSLNVGDYMNLIRLYCYNNKLTNLNLSGCTALENLSCYNNLLTNLDVSSNTKLASLDCSSNQLTTLDLSNNPALEYLKCRNNQLTTLDLSNNPALEYLDIYNNQLTTLNLGNNPGLDSLYCNYNSIPLSGLYNLSKSASSINNLGLQFLPSANLKVGGTFGEGENKFDEIYTEYAIFKYNVDTVDAIEGIDYSAKEGIVTFLNEGIYNVTMTNEAITSNLNIPAEVNIEIIVSEKGDAGIENNGLPQASVYPNPTSGIVNIENINGEEVSVFSASGVLVERTKENRIDLSNRPTGVYVLRIGNKVSLVVKK